MIYFVFLVVSFFCASSMNTTCNACGKEVFASYFGRHFQRYHTLTAKTFPCNPCDNFFHEDKTESAHDGKAQWQPQSHPQWKLMYRMRKDFCQCWIFARTQSKHAYSGRKKCKKNFQNGKVLKDTIASITSNCLALRTKMSLIQKALSERIVRRNILSSWH